MKHHLPSLHPAISWRLAKVALLVAATALVFAPPHVHIGSQPVAVADDVHAHHDPTAEHTAMGHSGCHCYALPAPAWPRPAALSLIAVILFIHVHATAAVQLPIDPPPRRPC